jgi:hypothetical protein
MVLIVIIVTKPIDYKAEKNLSNPNLSLILHVKCPDLFMLHGSIPDVALMQRRYLALGNGCKLLVKPKPWRTTQFDIKLWQGISLACTNIFLVYPKLMLTSENIFKLEYLCHN